MIEFLQAIWSALATEHGLFVLSILVALLVIIRTGINEFDVQTTRRLSIALLTMSGALLLAAFNLIGAGISAGDTVFIGRVRGSLIPLAMSAGFAIGAFIFAEIAAHKSTPSKGHPHSKPNYLQSAFVYISMMGLVNFLWGAVKLIIAAGSAGLP